MAKTAKPKSKSKPPTPHSRAARRALSPTLPLPASTNTRTPSPPPHPGSQKPHILAAQTHSGITKRTQSKPMKRAQRLRALKGAERAEENLDKLALKVAKSVGREKKVRERRKGWEDVNGEGLGKGKKARREKEGGNNAFGALDGEEGEGRKVREWGVDEDMDGVDGEEGIAGEKVEVVVKDSVPVPVETGAVGEGEDELL